MPAYTPLTNVALTGLARDLARRADDNKPIRIGVIGSGEMGTDLVTQCMLMRGVEIAAIATRRPHTDGVFWFRANSMRGRPAFSIAISSTMNLRPSGERTSRCSPTRNSVRLSRMRFSAALLIV